MCIRDRTGFTARELQAAFPGVGEDALAATVILQAWLDAQRATAHGAGETRSYGRIDLPPRTGQL